MSVDSKLEYWGEFYKHSGISLPDYPSQFSAFTINELYNIQSILEFGCGTGRDSRFFSKYGLRVIGIDASDEAIQICQKRSGWANLEYYWSKSSDSEGMVLDFLKSVSFEPVAVYGRFFLHAIDDAEQEKLLSMLHRLLPGGSKLFFEYRTTKDEDLIKTYGNDHYRRYLDHKKVLESLCFHGFVVVYEVEGLGFAKYKSEDAVVGRVIAVRSEE